MIQNETFKAEKAKKGKYWRLYNMAGEKIGSVGEYLELFDLIPISDLTALHDICTKIQEYEAGAEITHKWQNVATGQHLYLREKAGKHYVYLEDVYSECRCQTWDYYSKEDAEKGFWDKYNEISQQMFKIGGYS